MGLFNRRAASVDVARIAAEAAAETVKALVPGLGALPQGATTTELADRARDVAEAGMANVPFGPGIPLVPVGIDPREPGQRQPAPRRSEYPVAVNLNLEGGRHVPFSVLRDVADRVDVVRECIEVRKAHLTSLDWDITLSRRAIKQIMATDGLSSPGKAAQLARERLEPEMARLRAWWERPDRPNGLDFASWLSMLLEEQLVIDAVSIFPRRTLGGDVLAFELIDGSTIKPLLDRRGSTPLPPAPAYQQILYGFPRGEWQASDTADDEMTAAELVYRPRHRRTWSPYGFSATERALSAADLYLKRIAWIRSEFDDGVAPELWLKTDMGVGPQGALKSAPQLREFEAVMNDLLSGNTAERHRLHLLPKGFEPTELEGFAEKYQPALDEYLLKLVCMCFSVMPTEVGFPPSSGIGGKGHQEGEANSAFRKDIRPSVTWMASLLTEVSRVYLGMPTELEFTFIGYEVEDQLEAEQVADMRTKGARSTLNEERARMGRPLFDFPEADVPFVQTSAGIVFIPGALSGTAAMDAPGKPSVPGVPDPQAEAEEGVQPQPAPAAPGQVSDAPTPEPAAADVLAPAAGDEPVPDGHVRVAGHVRRKPTAAAAAEAKTFLGYVRKRAGRAWRDFEFVELAAAAGELNKAGAAGDMDLVRRLVATLTEE
jgi:hypothetical protein